jgi:hypothetical protein
MKVVPILYGAAAVLALSGLCLRLARPALPSADLNDLRVPGQQQPAATGDVAPAATSYQLIVAQNIFSQQRGAAPAKPAPPPRNEKPRDTEPALALRGTTIGPRGAVALIGAEVLRIGDVIDGAKLVASGPLVLHVPNSQRKKL